ncbi:MAG: hypothetical protein A3G33_10630 [Omnitrophica bacterium RIFCSPLOWO2_12_FULL_44_17]|uniref:PilZ domain-containing protein n=1 Tax=Candidatus Danuiimicrobium aquiferis TaxID=1801832 RepID=A0A1G1KR51_9BACT|nr:MAG: hypothetical protein A3B72_02950 [Omnitrophica bacterium RIFCSPHIGHO2_02_FULL_45_28]OGW89504.1 MAG: hypothetical protein A3E74_06960 [Omnitrophica bacterium RIFCSPHIGHO2_12_FULL_44_12]OGW95424.1 MAG: hypothetical protein A3G33_10630 [Omnitrophica bacterium RIFCSPLOWO2_12_FULL_44_17]OGX03306.1 MAG: hypothetical protein A3J12_07265 [Omnitrophica bacterium RIFCSPLOWO2_02_FULL_44_11]
MAWMGLNKREFPRVDISCDILIDDENEKQIIAKTENLGSGGVCVLLGRPLDKLSNVELKLSLGHDNLPLTCQGRVVWLVQSRDLSTHKTTYDTGIEFTNIKEEDRARISQFIKKLK